MSSNNATFTHSINIKKEKDKLRKVKKSNIVDLIYEKLANKKNGSFANKSKNYSSAYQGQVEALEGNFKPQKIGSPTYKILLSNEQDLMQKNNNLSHSPKYDKTCQANKTSKSNATETPQNALEKRGLFKRLKLHLQSNRDDYTNLKFNNTYGSKDRKPALKAATPSKSFVNATEKFNFNVNPQKTVANKFIKLFPGSYISDSLRHRFCNSVNASHKRKKSNSNILNLDVSQRKYDCSERKKSEMLSPFDLSNKSKPRNIKNSSTKAITISLEPKDMANDRALVKTERKTRLHSNMMKNLKIDSRKISLNSNQEDNKKNQIKNSINKKSRRSEEMIIFREISAVYKSEIDYESSFEQASTPEIKRKCKRPSSRKLIKGSFVNTSEINLVESEVEYDSKPEKCSNLYSVFTKAVPKGKINIAQIQSSFNGKAYFKENVTSGRDFVKHVREQKPSNELNAKRSTQIKNKIIFNNHNKNSESAKHLISRQPLYQHKKGGTLNLKPRPSAIQSPKTLLRDKLIGLEKEKDLICDTIKLY